MGKTASSGLFFLIFVSSLVYGEDVFRFANMYGDHMVLEQAPKRAVIWGFGEVGERVILKISRAESTEYYTTAEGKGKEGIWQVQLDPKRFGGPYRITALSKVNGTLQKITLNDVLFGDVWLCSGQSNMEYAVTQSENAQEEINRSSKYKEIRLFTAAHDCALAPRNELKRVRLPWSLPSPETVNGKMDYQYFSAVCWNYGVHLYKKLGYPIGLIVTAKKGSPIEAWMSTDALRSCNSSGVYKDKKIFKAPDWRVWGELLYSCLWNGMIHPLLKMTIHGAIWYQGETNGCKHYLMPYNCTFPSMVDDWRARWYAFTKNNTDPMLPFGFAQLSAVGTDVNKYMMSCHFPPLRWDQTADYGYVPNFREKNMFMAVTMDLGNLTSPYLSLHPTDKRLVGFRLALAGLAIAYGRNIYYTGPLVSTVRIFPCKGVDFLKIMFKSLQNKLEVRNRTGFEVQCESSKRWVPALIVFVGHNFVLTKPMSRCVPAKIRYSWTDFPCEKLKCAIYSGNLPSPPFMVDGPFSEETISSPKHSFICTRAFYLFARYFNV